jgi:membrane associated rhomboid family serine protease
MFSNLNNNQNPNNQNNQPTFKEKFKLWWSTVPFFIRCIMIITILFYILSWFFPDFTKALTNIPAYVIYDIQIWRLFTSSFVTLSIFNILFGFLAWIPDAIRLELTSGTIKYMFAFFINSIIIQIIYVALSFTLSIISKQLILMPSSGLWPVIMAEITILCLTNPDNQLRIMFLPCLVPAKYYPWALFAFFSVLNMNLQIDIIAGIIYGYLFHHFLKTKIQISDEFIIRIENISFVNKLANLNSFMSSSKSASITENGNYTPQSTNESMRGNFNSRNNNGNSFTDQNSSKPAAPASTPFQGPGSVLGCKKIHNLIL